VKPTTSPRGVQVDDFSILDSDPVVEYFKGMSPVHLTEQGRITRVCKDL
jgi:hypothetical protein